MSTEIENDVLAPEQVANPYPFFERMRRDEPVQWSDKYRAWFVYKYEDVFAALRDPAFSSDRVRPVFEHHLSEAKRDERRPTFDVLMKWMVFMDPPEHTRMRKLVMPAFTPKSIAAWRPRVEGVVGETLDEIGARSSIDLIHDFAYPIPAVVIAELMGVPSSDRDKFKKWSDEILTLVFGAGNDTRTPGASPERPGRTHRLHPRAYRRVEGEPGGYRPDQLHDGLGQRRVATDR